VNSAQRGLRLDQDEMAEDLEGHQLVPDAEVDQFGADPDSSGASPARGRTTA